MAALAGFAWTESMEADHIGHRAARRARHWRDGIVDPGFTLAADRAVGGEYKRGARAALHQAIDAAAGELQLVADFRALARRSPGSRRCCHACQTGTLWSEAGRSRVSGLIRRRRAVP